MTDKQSRELEAALRRREERATRNLYGLMIDGRKRHLKECKRKNCVECKDARALIPYYRERMKEELQRARSPQFFNFPAKVVDDGDPRKAKRPRIICK